MGERVVVDVNCFSMVTAKKTKKQNKTKQNKTKQKQKINPTNKTKQTKRKEKQNKIFKCQNSSTCAYAHVPFPLRHSCNKMKLLFQCWLVWINLLSALLTHIPRLTQDPKTINSKMLTWSPKNRTFERSTRTCVQTVL